MSISSNLFYMCQTVWKQTGKEDCGCKTLNTLRNFHLNKLFFCKILWLSAAASRVTTAECDFCRVVTLCSVMACSHWCDKHGVKSVTVKRVTESENRTWMQKLQIFIPDFTVRRIWSTSLWLLSNNITEVLTTENRATPLCCSSCFWKITVK